MQEDIVFEKTGFSVKYWSQFSETDFISECMRDGIFKQYKEADRKQMLQTVYTLIKAEYDTPRTTKTAKEI